MLQLLPLEEWERCEGAAQREQLEASVGKFRARAKQLKDLIEQSEVRLTEVRAEEAHLIATLAEARQEKERNGVWLKEARGALKHMAEDQAKSQRGFAFGQR